MSIVYMLFIFFLAIRYIVKTPSRKNYIITAVIITLISLLLDIKYLISNPLSYFLSGGWQVLVAFVIMVAYTFAYTISHKRERAFNKKANTKTKDYITTAKSKGMYLIIASIITLLVGGVLIAIKLLTDFNVPYIAFIGSIIGFIILLIVGIIEIKTTNEKFIFIISTDDEFLIYEKNIDSKFKFNYMDYICDIYRYYIIEKLGEFKISGDLKETHYVWILKTENLNNYDISKSNMGMPNLSMAKSAYIWYNEIVRDTYVSKGGRFNVSVENNKAEIKK